MSRDELLALIRAHRDELEHLGVNTLSVFGSMARGQVRDESDVDVLVDFARPVGLFEFARLKLYLEDLLGRPVDLVTPQALRDEFRESILREAVRVA
jgi:predicted nucleotidyltransferase